MTQLIPRQPVPALSVETVDHGRWTLADQTPENFTLIAFYRGYHCPKCRVQLRELEANLAKFAQLGVDVIAISSNPAALAVQAQTEWELTNLTIGHSLTIDQARTWGLFVSDAIKSSEPAQFSEPAIYIVRPDGTLYASIVYTMPFARTKAAELLGSLKQIITNDYPARGEVV